MMDKNSEDWLPRGCTVKVKVRDNGKKVVIEKAMAEGLPPGWIKEVKVTKKANKIRRDPYYIDPASGYVFRSMRDALRYLKTGKPGRNAYKPKDKQNSTVELEDDKVSSPAVAEEDVSTVRKTSGQVAGNSDQTETSKDGNGVDCSPNPDNCADQHEAKDSEQLSGGSDSSKLGCVSEADDAVLHKQDPESEPEKHENKAVKVATGRSRKNKDASLPRRASKRLAGIDVDPIPELKTRTRVRRAAEKDSSKQVDNPNLESSETRDQFSSKCSDGEEAKQEIKIPMDSFPKIDASSDSIKRKRAYNDLATPEELVRRVKSKAAYDEKQQNNSLLPPGNQGSGSKLVGIETEVKADGKLLPALELPSEDLLTDPCIAFAISTLTGISFDTPKSSEQLLGTGYRQQPCGDPAAGKQNDRKREKKNIIEKKGSNMQTHVEVGNVESIGNSGLALELPLPELSADPCIEFAIKTLTGEIPLDCDLSVGDQFQKQQSSSENEDGIGFTSVGVNHLYQADVYTVGKPVFMQPAVLEPAPPQIRHVSFQSWGAGGLHQNGKERNNRVL